MYTGGASFRFDYMYRSPTVHKHIQGGAPVYGGAAEVGHSTPISNSATNYFALTEMTK